MNGNYSWMPETVPIISDRLGISHLCHWLTIWPACVSVSSFLKWEDWARFLSTLMSRSDFHSRNLTLTAVSDWGEHVQEPEAG